MPETLTLHATCLDVAGRGVLICGVSGSGKSGLGLQLMAFGATLVADDRTDLRVQNGDLLATCPETIRGQIEARHLGLLNAPATGQTRVVAMVDLDVVETKRLPPPRTKTLMGVTLPVLHKVDSPSFAAALLQYLKAGKQDVI